MKLKLFTLLASSFLSTSVSMACGGEWRDPNCYMFSVYDRNEQKNYVKQNVEFWKKYTGNRFNDWEVERQLNNTGSDEEADNLLLNLLKSKGDKDAVQYLEKLKEMKSAAALSENSWDYPTKEELAQNKQDWSSIYAFAMKKLKEKRTMWHSRYVLMAMRGAFYSGHYDDLAQIWLTNSKLVRENDIMNQCQGYLANNWIRSGWVEKARDYYIKAGSLNDLRATFPQQINTATIKALFEKYPNSNSFPYLLQSYLNSMHSNLTAYEATAQSVKENNSELVQFVKFANAVLKTKAQNQALWQSAKGYAIYLLGSKDQAYEDFQKAMQMTASPRVVANARCLSLLCKSELMDLNDKSELVFTKELTWLREKVLAEKPYYDYGLYRFRNHYTDVMDRVVHQILVPRYQKAGKHATAALLANVANELSDVQVYGGSRCTLVNNNAAEKYNTDYSTDVFRMLDTIPLDELKKYYSVMTQNKGSEFERSLVPFCYSNSSYLSDVVATRLMREFKFKEALDYLKKVDAKFTANMNILPYLAYDYNVEFWIDRQTQPKSQKVVGKGYANKSDFCKQMMAWEGDLETARKKKKLDAKYAEKAYQLAVTYMQASQVGKSWALTNYSYTSYFDSARVANDPYLKRAEELLRSALQHDASEKNVVRCLTGLFFMSKNYNRVADEASFAKQLWALKDTPSADVWKISSCDLLKNYKASK